MKDWLTIGQFAKKVGLTAKAVRFYEKSGLLSSHARGENGYRYYSIDQLELGARIKEFRGLGFSVLEIAHLLKVDTKLNIDKMQKQLETRLHLIEQQSEELLHQKKQITSIISSLNQKRKTITVDQRRAVMKMYSQVSVVVTGIENLAGTASRIKTHLDRNGADTTICDSLEVFLKLPSLPKILVLPEESLNQSDLVDLNPEVIVVNGLSSNKETLIDDYKKLFTNAGPQLSTIFNADDRVSVELARQAICQKGAIFYYSKNKALEKQIRNIGGVISDGDELFIYGFNRGKEEVNLKFAKFLPHAEEIMHLSALTAVMDLGLEKNTLSLD